MPVVVLLLLCVMLLGGSGNEALISSAGVAIGFANPVGTIALPTLTHTSIHMNNVTIENNYGGSGNHVGGEFDSGVGVYSAGLAILRMSDSVTTIQQAYNAHHEDIITNCYIARNHV